MIIAWNDIYEWIKWTHKAHIEFSTAAATTTTVKQCAYFIACKMIDGLKSAHDKNRR